MRNLTSAAEGFSGLLQLLEFDSSRAILQRTWEDHAFKSFGLLWSNFFRTSLAQPLMQNFFCLTGSAPCYMPKSPRPRSSLSGFSPGRRLASYPSGLDSPTLQPPSGSSFLCPPGSLYPGLCAIKLTFVPPHAGAEMSSSRCGVLLHLSLSLSSLLHDQARENLSFLRYDLL